MLTVVCGNLPRAALSVYLLVVSLVLVSLVEATKTTGESITMTSVHEKTTKSLGSGTVPFDVEHYPVAPGGLELEQVHLYVRHGERTPVRVRMADPPASIPDRWIMCKTARRFRAAVTSDVHDHSKLVGFEELPVRSVVERGDGSVVEGECLLGELTDIGRQHTYNFGLALRKLYVDRLNFLPDTIHSDAEVYFRSTNVPRTFESLHQIVHGVYPSIKCANGYVPQLRIRNSRDENLFGNTAACKRLQVLEIGFARAAAAAWNHALEPLDDRIGKYIGGNPVRLDGQPRASGIFDTVRSAMANNVSVPQEFNEKGVMDVMEKAVVHEWFGGYDSEEVKRLGMGRLLDDVSTKMQLKAVKGSEDPMRLLVHSTHDTTLAGICASLDVFDEKWPAFTSYISFELFRRKEAVLHNQTYFWQTVLSRFQRSSPDEFYVRMRYQNKSLSLPMCADEGKHLPGYPEFCTLAAFRDRVKELTPVDWDAECSVE
ncbi:histidine phosphatase superfamily [Cytidiella melzeri]|nr:histidine phosphatase superfamily [Cytidiella melzeri]